MGEYILAKIRVRHIGKPIDQKQLESNEIHNEESGDIIYKCGMCGHQVSGPEAIHAVGIGPRERRFKLRIVGKRRK